MSKKELEVSKALYNSIFETTLDAITISRLTDGLYIDVSESFLQIMGYERDEVIGRTLLIWASGFLKRIVQTSQMPCADHPFVGTWK